MGCGDCQTGLRGTILKEQTLRIRVPGIVTSVTSQRSGIQEIRVNTESGEREAVNYPQLTGYVSVGDRVVLNTCAVEMKLGTGGIDFVASVEASVPPERVPGHIIKLRYTPLQTPVLAAEAPESPYHDAVSGFDSLHGTPVVCAEIHSQVAAVAAAIKWETKGEARVAYILTEGGALPMAFSSLAASLKSERLLDCTISAGQTFGGDYESVNLYSALAVAESAARANIIIICQGPGAVGTDTRLGFSGVEQGTALNAVASLGGTPIAVVRMSEADPRPRHRGISHHTVTVLGSIALCRALVPVPRPTRELGPAWRKALEGTRISERHDIITVDVEPAMEALSGIGKMFTTMGRSLEDDRAFFEASVAAGLVAGQCYTASHG